MEPTPTASNNANPKAFFRGPSAMSRSDTWMIWHYREDEVLRSLIFNQFGGQNENLLTYREIATLMNGNRELYYVNSDRVYNEYALRHHWREIRREELEMEAEKQEEKLKSEAGKWKKAA